MFNRTLYYKDDLRLAVAAVVFVAVSGLLVWLASLNLPPDQFMR